MTFLLILFAAILVLAASFLFVDFRAMRSATTADSQTATSSSGEPAGFEGTLQVFVQAPAGLEGRLQRALQEQLGLNQYFPAMAPLEAPPAEAGAPVLIVAVEPQAYLWTPVYARSRLEARLGLASDGRVSWTDLGEVDTVFQGDPAVRISADLSIADRSYGLISRPAYQEFLAEYIAGRAAETLKGALQTAVK